MDSVSGAGARDLVRRARDGEADAWAALTDLYTDLLWSLARGLRLSHADAADAVQTTWLRLVEHLDDIHDPERIGAWLATTMRRECLGTLRRRARAVGSTDLEDIPAGSDPVDAALLQDERDAALWRAFTVLEPRCQLLLRTLMSDPPPSYAEAATALDMPIGSIGPTRRRCLEQLRKVMLADVYPFDVASATRKGDWNERQG
jgi:RNA polymerase sigma factor (sigma-70 family)